jgi:hypothetical protein
MLNVPRIFWGCWHVGLVLNFGKSEVNQKFYGLMDMSHV